MIINEAWRKENRRLSTVIYGGVMIACVTCVGTISGYISRYTLKEFHIFFDGLTVVHKMLGGKNDCLSSLRKWYVDTNYFLCSFIGKN